MGQHRLRQFIRELAFHFYRCSIRSVVLFCPIKPSAWTQWVRLLSYNNPGCNCEIIYILRAPAWGGIHTNEGLLFKLEHVRRH